MSYRRIIRALTVAVLATGLPAVAGAQTIAFRIDKTDKGWVCKAPGPLDSKATAEVKIEALIGDAASAAKAALTAAFKDKEGKDVEEKLKLDDKNKQLLLVPVSSDRIDLGAPVALNGRVDTTTIDKESCTYTPAAQEVKEPEAGNKGQGTAKPTANTYTKLDRLAQDWFDKDEKARGQLSAIRDSITLAFPSLSRDDVVIVAHLPSGSQAAQFPASISERQHVQVVAIVEENRTTNVQFEMTTCTVPVRERTVGDFSTLAGQFAAGQEEPAPAFRIIKVGSLVHCGADEMAYKLTVNTDKIGEAAPVSTSIRVRPVYHLAATAAFGFDWARQSTFTVRSGKVGQDEDRIGTGVMAGATWYPFGVDFEDMRWYNHFLNPIVLVSVANPSDNFVVGTTITVTGGIGIVLGMSFHHVTRLTGGFAVGDAFTGEGDVPTTKAWASRGRGLYIGVSLDQNIHAAISKLKQSGGAKATGK